MVISSLLFTFGCVEEELEVQTESGKEKVEEVFDVDDEPGVNNNKEISESKKKDNGDTETEVIETGGEEIEDAESEETVSNEYEEDVDTGDIVEDRNEENTLPEERIADIEAMKSEQFYRYHYLDHLGWTAEKIIEKYSEPTSIDERPSIGIYNRGDRVPEKTLQYKDRGIVFRFLGDEELLHTIILSKNSLLLGVRVGMTLKEIEDVLGEPDHYGGCPTTGAVIRSYFFGDIPEDECSYVISHGGLSDLQVSFRASEKDAPTENAFVTWNKLIKQYR